MKEAGALLSLSVLSLLAVSVGHAQQRGATPPDVFASAADTYTNAASTACSKTNDTNPYAGMNPLVCQGVSAPVDSAGQCSLAKMNVLGKQGNTCFYCQPISPPIQGFIVPLGEVGIAGQQGFVCGEDQANPLCMAVCQGDGTFRPPAGTTLLKGSKDVVRVPAPAPPSAAPSGPNMAAIVEAMNACLSAEVPYWKPQSLENASLTSARAFAGQDNPTIWAPVFLDGMAMTLESEAAHKAQYNSTRYGIASEEYSPTAAADYMTGWLYGCLYNAKLVPETWNFSAGDPRILYSQFLGVDRRDRRISDFSFGFHDYPLPPLLMLPPGITTFGTASP